MKAKMSFIYGSMSMMLGIHTLVSLCACINKLGWGWYISLLISVFAVGITIQMWNYTADQK